PKAPTIGPSRVPRPPTATQMIISMDGRTPILAGVMMPTWGTYSAPATPASTADTTNTNSLNIAGEYPEKSTRVSLSRIATSTLPTGDRVIHRHTRYAPHRQSAVATYRPRWVDAEFSVKPKTVLKPESPLVPPRFMALRLNMSHADSARAWVMIAK